MNPPTEREITAAIRVLDLLRRSIDDADSEEGRKHAPETSEQLQARMARSRVVERLASIDESVTELRRWSHQLNARQVRGQRHGSGI